jgi:cytochrome oxidase Cu insertion factor (SCO1/SenC/PrrC family)
MKRIMIVFAATTIIALAGFAVYLSTAPRPGPGGVSGQVRTIGEALVGGPFTLTDHTGKRVTDNDFRGRYMLVYFGYTWCPDVCPTELQVISAALDHLGDEAGRIRPIFVTVDPERDTVAQMADYVANFHASLVGLTGSPEEIAGVAKAYRVYYAKAKTEGSDTDYTVDHGSLIYLMDPEGKFVTHFTYGTDPEKLAQGLAKAIGGGS